MHTSKLAFKIHALTALSLMTLMISAPFNALAEEPAKNQASTDEDAGNTDLDDDSDSLDSEPLDPEEDPELPDEMLVIPEEDPGFIPDPNQQPIEEDFIRMPLLRSPLYWRLELREQLGGTSNVDQLLDAPGSLTNRTTVTGLLRYTFPTQTQILLRSQAFMFNFMNLDQRDQFLAIPLSLTATQWFSDNWNVYTGYLPIFSSSLNRTSGNIQRWDQDALLGTSYFLPIGDNYLFGGYQLDYMHASLENFRYLGNLFFAGYRHSLSKDVFLFVDGRVQPRSYLNSPDIFDEFRFGGGAAVQWQVFKPWLILEARGDYNQIINFSTAERNTGIFSLGVNLIAALQSES